MCKQDKIELVKKILERHYGGVYKRIDENRELLDVLQREAPELLAKRPWIVGWLEAQDGFLCDLEAVVSPTDVQFPERRGSLNQNFPRPWPFGEAAPLLNEGKGCDPQDNSKIAQPAEGFVSAALSDGQSAEGQTVRRDSVASVLLTVTIIVLGVACSLEVSSALPAAASITLGVWLNLFRWRKAAVAAHSPLTPR